MTRPARAIVLGATGAVGSRLVRELLASPHWSAVVALTRRVTDMFAGAEGEAKLTVRVVDLTELEQHTRAALIGASSAAASARDADERSTAAFCTLGVGQPRKVSREEFHRVDVEYASAFARACRTGGVSHFSLLSAVGAAPDARSWYLRVKGEIETAVQSLRFERASFFRPSLLVTSEIRYGLQDWLTQRVFPRISPLLPSRFHEIGVEDVARAMRLNAERPARASVEVLHYTEMAALGSEVRSARQR